MAQIQPSHAKCIHCGTAFLRKPNALFCCSGCEFVYGLINSEGLGRYYLIRDSNPPICPIPAQTSSSTYDFCDDPEYINKLSPDGMTIRFYLEGLNCTACLWLLEKLPTFCPDAASARVNMAASTIEIKRTPSGSFAAIARTLNRFGYRPHPLRDTEEAVKLRTRERRNDIIRIGVAGAATGNIMILAVSLYGGATGALALQFRWLSALLALPVLTYCAWPFYRSALSSIKSRHLNLDVPIVVAIAAGVATSLWALLTSAETVYFDSLSMLVFLLLSSRLVLKAIQSQQLQSTNLEDELLLATVQRLDASGNIEKLSSLSLKAGDLIRIEEDSIIPVDGVVEKGKGGISAAVLTGESSPIRIKVGAVIEAGSRNLFGQWDLRVENPPSQTRLARILRDTEKSAREKSNFVHFSDRISRWFMITVLGAAALLILAFLTSDPHEGISRALALVIVTCPCVFGIAIPLSMSFAIRAAARRGIVIKNADAIERLWNVKTLYFDKTGTLTTGEMSVLRMEANNQTVLGIALALEAGQSHPVARAITKHLREKGVQPIPVNGIEPLPGGGMMGHALGILYTLKPFAQFPLTIDDNANSLNSSYALFCEHILVAVFHLGDQPRPQSTDLLKWARQHKFSTRLISGDRRPVVEACARILEFNSKDVQYEMTPERKTNELKSHGGGTAMIGDGANDAAALAAADVGIAVCGSLDASLRAADIYLIRPNLTAIADLFSISRLTQKAIWRNLIFSASFNIVSGICAASGWMTPLWAAVLMPLSSITILMSAVWTGNHLTSSKENK